MCQLYNLSSDGLTESQEQPAKPPTRKMASKFNPNAITFVPSNSKQSTPTPLSQSKQQKSNPNISSHIAPPPAQSKVKRGSYSKNGRPREVKGFNSRKYSSGSEGTVIHDDFDLNIEDEVLTGQFKSRGRRGQISINHLLDFSLPSRDLEMDKVSRAAQVRRRRRSDQDDKIHLRGEEFVNANYRFIVDYRHDYKGQTLDPNLVLENSSVLRVIVPKGNYCPICLTEDIVAPRMISCGHIFCHTCLLSFLESEGTKKKEFSLNKYKECPLCSFSVKPDEIKPVLINQADERFEIPQVGQDVILRLMAKPVDSILAIPFSLNLNHQKIGNIPWYSDTELYPYARIMKGGLKFLVHCYEADKAAITKQYEEDKLLYNDDGVYVRKALEEIDLHLKLYKEGFADNYDEPNPLVNSMDNLSINKNVSGLNDSNCYFFYQTAFNSSTRYFLSPLDVKVLLHTYGSYANFPSTLLLKVDNINYDHMVTENTLKKYKYFGHLPLGTELAFIDVNWKNMLSPEVFKVFAKELNERRKRILTKLKKEDRAKKSFDVQQELKTLDFYKTENDGWGTYDFVSQERNFGVNEEQSLHPLGDEEIADENINEGTGGVTTEDDKEQTNEFLTTVWGTKIPKGSKVVTEDDYENDWEADELIRIAKEDKQGTQGSKRKGRKKNLVVLTSSSGRGY